MPQSDEVVAEEPEVVEQAEEVKEGETLADAAQAVAENATEETEGAAKEEGEDEKVTTAVNKALAAQATKLAEARKEAADKARIEAENRLYREEIERLRNPKKEPTPDPEVTLPDGFDLLPEAAQRDYLNEKRARLALEKRLSAQEARAKSQEEETIRTRVQGAIDSMKADTENYPGFDEVYPQIEEMGRTDPAFLQGVISNPKKYIRMAYKDLTAERAPVLAERELEKKIQKQKLAQTTRPSARDTGGTIKRRSVDDILEDAWTKAGGVAEE